MHRLFVSTVLCLGLFAVEASSQSQSAASSPTTTLRTYSTIVVLDGVALDAKGNPVLDLKQEDFHIFEDKAPQQLQGFEAPGQAVTPPNVDVESTADLDRLAPQAPVNIVLLDEFNTRFEDMAFARYSLKRWLDKQPGRLEEPTMLIAVSLGKFEVLRDYTQDRQKILDALNHHFAAFPWQAHSLGWVPERFALAFMTLRRVAEASSGHAGHKNMIWLGRGFPNINLEATDTDSQQQVASAVQQTVNELRDARVTLYTIDPAGVMVHPEQYGDDAGSFAVFGGEPNFDALSRATGGRPLHGRNDVDAAIGTAIRDGASLYSMSYRPTSRTYDPATFRMIRVVVDRPGVTFVTRQGYYPQTGPARANANGSVGTQLATELITASTGNMAYDAVPFSVQTSATDANDWRVQVEPRAMSWSYGEGNEARRSELLVMITTYDRKGKLLKSDAKRLEFKAPASAGAAADVHFPYRLEADPRAVRARMAVRVEATGHMGTVDLPLRPGMSVSSTGHAASGSPASAEMPKPEAR